MFSQRICTAQYWIQLWGDFWSFIGENQLLGEQKLGIWELISREKGQNLRYLEKDLADWKIGNF